MVNCGIKRQTNVNPMSKPEQKSNTPARAGEESAAAYRHAGEVAHRPDVGVEAQFARGKRARVYRYDSSIAPAAGVAVAGRFFLPMYKRAAPMQATPALVGFIAGLLAWFFGGGRDMAYRRVVAVVFSGDVRRVAGTAG